MILNGIQASSLAEIEHNMHDCSLNKQVIRVGQMITDTKKNLDNLANVFR